MPPARPRRSVKSVFPSVTRRWIPFLVDAPARRLTRCVVQRDGRPRRRFAAHTPAPPRRKRFLRGARCHYFFVFLAKSPFWGLTFPPKLAILFERLLRACRRYGEMAERLMAPVLKTGDAERHRGFKSLSLRQFLPRRSLSACRRVMIRAAVSRRDRLPPSRVTVLPPYVRRNATILEKYPSGRRGSPAKGVGCDKRRPGSNPGFSAKMPVNVAKQRLQAFSIIFPQTFTQGKNNGKIDKDLCYDVQSNAH